MKLKLITAFAFVFIAGTSATENIKARQAKSFSWLPFFGGSSAPVVPPVPPISQVAPLRQYPIWRIHKYNGIDLKPVLPHHLPPNVPFAVGKNIPVGAQTYGLPPQVLPPRAVEQSSVYPQQDTQSGPYPGQGAIPNPGFNPEDQIDPRAQNRPNVEPSQPTLPSGIPQDIKITPQLLELANKLGIKSFADLPSLDQAQSLLGTTSTEETLNAIMEIASTPEGLDLIKNFLNESSNQSGAATSLNEQSVASPVSSDLISSQLTPPISSYTPNSFYQPLVSSNPSPVAHNIPQMQYTPPSDAYSLPREPLPQSLLSISGIPSAIDTAKTDVDLLGRIIQKPSLGFLGNIRSGISSLFSGASESEPPVTASPADTVPKTILLPQLPELAPLPEIHGLSNLPSVPSIPEIHLPNGFNANQNGYAGPYVRVQYPAPGFQQNSNAAQPDIQPSQYNTPESPIPSDEQNYIIPSTSYGYPETSYPINQYSIPTDDYSVPDTPKTIQQQNNFASGQFVPSIQTSAGNYEAFKNAPQVVNNYGAPDLPYTYPVNNGEYAAASQIENKVANANTGRQENYGKAILNANINADLEESKENNQSASKDQNVNVSQANSNTQIQRRDGSVPQRISPYDFYSTGRIHRTSAENIRLLPMTQHQMHLRTKQVTDAAHPDDDSKMADVVSSMTSGLMSPKI